MMYQVMASPWCYKLRSAARTVDGRRTRPASPRPCRHTVSRAGGLRPAQSPYGWRAHTTSRHACRSAASRGSAAGRHYVAQ